MGTDNPLASYLNDHLAGSVAAIELLEHLTKHAGGPTERDFFAGLRADIASDQEVLKEILNRVGGSESELRKAGAWISEKASRLKLRLEDGAGLSRLEALETLALGITGKMGLWRVLSMLSDRRPELVGVDYARLEQFAERQHADVEARRLEAAQAAF
ncbi:MAG TPA: hypothetical protein VFW66_02010 [Gemmatimonadales bacterium]|nr:hypothetical protein [Gemmatimonadales bacterium]